jgi:hypothetical protein
MSPFALPLPPRRRLVSSSGITRWADRPPVEVLVCNGSGLHDAASSIFDRALVAEHLWVADIR